MQTLEFSQLAHTPGYMEKLSDLFLDNPQALCEFFQQGEICEITEFLPPYGTGWSQKIRKFGSESKSFVKKFFFIPLLTILNHQNNLKLLFLGFQILTFCTTKLTKIWHCVISSVQNEYKQVQVRQYRFSTFWYIYTNIGIIIPILV